MSGAAIRHVDRGFVLAREGDHGGLFRDAELLDAVEAIAAGRPALVAEARAVLAGEEPDLSFGVYVGAEKLERLLS